MSTRAILRCGAVSAVAGGACQLVATVSEPDIGGGLGRSITVAASNGPWVATHLLDLVGAILTIVGLTAAGVHAVSHGSGSREWFRLGQPLLLLMGSLGAAAILVSATLQDLAQAWLGDPASRTAYAAVFDAVRGLTDNLFFGAFLALGLYLAALAAAVRAGREYAAWIGWLAAASAVLLLVGDPLMLLFDGAFLLVLAGFAAFLVVVMAIGVTMWRLAGAMATAEVTPGVYSQR